MKTDFLSTMLNRLQEQEKGVTQSLSIIKHLKGERSTGKPIKLTLLENKRNYPVFDLLPYKET